ncbi:MULTISPECIES: DUF2281 domain-containing protein [unclassified Microcystis]|uniref:DUF2281 domain-containing protein n=1 Tax=unclassified Microcystis TaxID=2643300 RepID=UPI002590E0FD|nr:MULTISPECIES: DUF2281 domain-containing protein [unclassified Microcystis]
MLGKAWSVSHSSAYRYKSDQTEENKQAAKESVTVKRTLAGSIKGTFVLPLANDFDAPLEDFEDYR